MRLSSRNTTRVKKVLNCSSRVRFIRTLFFNFIIYKTDHGLLRSKIWTLSSKHNKTNVYKNGCACACHKWYFLYLPRVIINAKKDVLLFVVRTAKIRPFSVRNLKMKQYTRRNGLHPIIYCPVVEKEELLASWHYKIIHVSRRMRPQPQYLNHLWILASDRTGFME